MFRLQASTLFVKLSERKEQPTDPKPQILAKVRSTPCQIRLTKANAQGSLEQPYFLRGMGLALQVRYKNIMSMQFFIHMHLQRNVQRWLPNWEITSTKPP